MSTTVPTEQPQAQTCATPTTDELVEILRQAAATIERDGLHRAGYWYGDLLLDYAPGVPVDAIGALAVATGLTRTEDVEIGFLGLTRYDPRRHTHVGGGEPHPAVRVLREHLRLRSVEGVFAWSDSSSAAQVATEMRTAAAMLAIGARS